MSNFEILRLTGRCSNGAERDGGRLYHAVKGIRALCGKQPGRRSDWGVYPGKAVTCPRCLRCLRKMGVPICSECGQPGSEVKPAHEYPELYELLKAWGAAGSNPDVCPSCVVAVCADLRGETVTIIPFC